jgi:hypothetical protein
MQAWFTPNSLSPVIAPRSSAPTAPDDIDGDGTADRYDTDDDNDRLSDAIEGDVRTDPLRKDTDGDGREDGWEYYSAKDLNHEAVPYPAKKPYPNALYPESGNVDWDGDSLTSNEEHALWVRAFRSFDLTRASNGRQDSVLGYSDGTQRSRPEEPSQTPPFVHPDIYDAKWAYPSYPSFLEGPNAGDDVYSDDERDGDNDGLNNYHETHGALNEGQWNARLKGCLPEVKPWRDPDGAYYGKFDVVAYPQTDYVDSDTDGDGLLDGEDDQDRDDVPNFSELDFRCADGLADGDPTTGANVHPYNPCAPDPSSRTCWRYKPVGDSH